MTTTAALGRAWQNQTVDDSDPTQILSKPAKRVLIICTAASGEGLRVNVRNAVTQDSIHPAYVEDAPATYFVLEPGESYEFRAPNDNLINSVIVDGDGATATFSGTVGEV